MTVASLSEDALISQLFAPIAGAGSLDLRDDAALLPAPAGSELVLTVDVVVADVHFFRNDPPGTVARKALRVNLSDLAAKGAEPLGFLLALSLPKDTSLAWITAFSEGLGADARVYGCPLLGGDTVRTPGPLTVSITALGRVPTGYMVRRTGARAGDILAVTGTIGDSALGLRLRLAERDAGSPAGEGAPQEAGWRDVLTPAEQTHLTQRYLLPEPRNAVALALREHAGGAMDVSDGLIGDARKFLRASGVSGDIDLDRVPLSAAVHAAVEAAPELLLAAATGGDDYEVLCSVAPERFGAFQRLCEGANVPVAAIGRVTAGDAPLTVRRDGVEITVEHGSFSHF
ncbi:thiamine-monophosphate kinase [Pseudochelatococcus lubricantis]|uniref:Thiamine-monophosphate kinase n=1 Tax=Pseudochelatococcus lubricantis TaxID=1538102 RepID=A0ABX0V600_9HYPH|nr:thiamine-phosphate kinase [Pseudochelatococcus lubricantis]NIJ60013.1 thiamine-monophosphate kinase [Pseudochelatococcus lubricantis]